MKKRLPNGYSVDSKIKLDTVSRYVHKHALQTNVTNAGGGNEAQPRSRFGVAVVAHLLRPPKKRMLHYQTYVRDHDQYRPRTEKVYAVHQRSSQKGA